MTRKLTDVETLALAKLIKEKDFKAGSKIMTPGKYKVGLTVKVEGILSKAEDTKPAAQTPGMLSLAAVATILDRCGVVGPHILKNVLETYAEAKAAGEDASEALLKDRPKARELVATIKAEFEKLPKVPRSGAVSFAGIIEPLEDAPPVGTLETAAKLAG